MRPQIVRILTLVLLLLTSTPMLCQTSGADQGPPPPDQIRPPELFIDESLIWLVIAGLFLGAYVLLRNKRATNTLR